MIRSMTGYGRAEALLPDKKVIIEIRSLNSKTNDTTVKLPSAYRSKEIELRQLIAERLIRGKIDLVANFELNTGTAPAVINREIVKAYYNQLHDLNAELDAGPGERLLDIVMKLPDTVRVEKYEVEEAEWLKITEAVMAALNQLDLFRREEGSALQKDIIANIANILDGLDRIPQYEKARIDKIREKINTQVRDLGIGDQVDKNRFEQELIYYLEKMDITEEKVRLEHHCKYFTEVLHNEEYAGKKLGFILQEIGREINTLGSKASDQDIQKIVVGMKDDLEKIKEQILNIL